MALDRTNIPINFTTGDYNSTHKDANGFWLTIGTYNSKTDIALNETRLDISDLTLNHTTAGKFTSRSLNVYLRAEFTLNDDPTVNYIYFFGDSNGSSIGSKSMPNTTLTLIASTQIAVITIPHNDDGTSPYVTIRGYCNAASAASYLPANTTAYTGGTLVFDRIPRGPRVKDNGVWKNTVLYVKNNGAWTIAIPYVKDNGTWKIGGG